MIHGPQPELTDVDILRPPAEHFQTYPFAGDSAIETGSRYTSMGVDRATHSTDLPKLSAAGTEAAYQVHMAAVEWTLDTPITIRTEADIQSKRTWRTRFSPYAHQVQNLITFCRRAPVALLADDVGLGKTISAGLILSELLERKKVKRALVLAPNLLLPQWIGELRTKFDVDATSAKGAGVPLGARSKTPVFVTTYASMRSYAGELKSAGFDMLILDEAHKLRNLHPNTPPPQFASEIRRALADQAFKFVLMLTATPIQNRLWDLYSLVDLLTAAKRHRNPFGPPAEFRAVYLNDASGLSLNAAAKSAFRRHLATYIVRTRRDDAKLAFPRRRVHRYLLGATEGEARIAEAVGELFREGNLNALEQSSIGQAFMSSPAALLKQLEGRATKDVATSSCLSVVRTVVNSGRDPAKLQSLLKLISELATQRPHDWRVVVFTSRLETLDCIRRRLESEGYAVGVISGNAGVRTQRWLDDFRATPPAVRVIVSSDAGAEGVNLQAANVLVNFDLPWNPMLLEQRIGRIQRLASTHAEVHVFNLVLAGSVEEKVVDRLATKLLVISESIGDIESILESAGMDEDDSKSFESRIRDLVTQSLRQIDTAEAVRLAAESIDRGKRAFEEEKETVERTLGNLADLHRAGPEVPEIAPRTPSVSYRDFVMKALELAGASVRATDNEVFEVRQSGQAPFLLTFDEDTAEQLAELQTNVFGGNAPKLFLPGKPSFERLAQQWTDRAASRVVDLSNVPSELGLLAVQEHFAPDGAVSIKAARELRRRPVFQGEITCRASAVVRHDRIEDLVTTRVAPDSEWEVDVEHADDEATAPFDPSKFATGFEDKLYSAVESSANIRKFCDFYEARLAEELQRAPAASQSQVRDTFKPATAATLIAAKGAVAVELELSVTAEIQGAGKVSFLAKVRPSAKEGSRIELTPPWKRCEQSGRFAPEAALAQCALTGAWVLKDLLAASDSSGRRCRSELAVVAADSGRTLLPDETVPCAVTGVALDAERAARCAVSGRPAMRSALVTCDFTGALVLPDLIRTSDVSGRRFRSDESSRSEESGRTGHKSEFVRSVDPEAVLAIDEADQSDLSGAYGLKGRVGRSAKPPHRRGLASELAPSRANGKLYLIDELSASGVSGKRALPEEFRRCSFTQTLGLPDEMEISQISQREFRRDQALASAVSGLRGHRDEFVKSSYPPGWIATAESSQSQLSGDFGSTALLRHSSRPPHRCGFPAEFVLCEVSGQPLLRDEVGVSEVSGKRVDTLLLKASAVSGRLALPEELIICDSSGVALHPDEAGRCSITGRMVDRRLLVPSDESGRLALKQLLVECAQTHKRLLPEETVECPVLGAKVARSSCDPCFVTGRFACRDRLATCPSTNLRFIEDATTQEAVIAKAGPGPILRPDLWSGKPCMATRMRRCALCGLAVAESSLNAAGELQALRSLLNAGSASGRPLSPERIELLRAALHPHGRATSGESVVAPSGEIELLRIHCKAGLLGLSAREVGYIIDRSGAAVCSPLVGRVRSGHWVAEST